MNRKTSLNEELVKDGCFTIDESVDFTGIRRSKLYEHIRNRRIATVKLGRRTLIPKRSLIQFLAENLATPKREVEQCHDR
jgi:excisionase family DNA binding protein